MVVNSTCIYVIHNTSSQVDDEVVEEEEPEADDDDDDISKDKIISQKGQKRKKTGSAKLGKAKK